MTATLPMYVLRPVASSRPRSLIESGRCLQLYYNTGMSLHISQVECLLTFGAAARMYVPCFLMFWSKS